jgi:hypothetical protein
VRPPTRSITRASPLDSPALCIATGEHADLVEKLLVEDLRRERCDLDQVRSHSSRNPAGVATDEISADLPARA